VFILLTLTSKLFYFFEIGIAPRVRDEKSTKYAAFIQ